MTRGRASLLLAAAVCAHDLEEALTFPMVRPRAAALAARVAPGLQLPGGGAFQLALLAFTLAVVLLLIWAASTRRETAAWTAIKAVAVVLLANILIPHVPAAIALGGYAPGVVTAVALNLPIGLWVLVSAPRRA